MMGLVQRLRALFRHVWWYCALRWRAGPWKLHLGCGQQRRRGFVNIDRHFTRASDLRADISRNLPCKCGTIKRIEAYHVVEHIPEPIVREVLSYWRSLLTTGGVLVLECPDLEADLREVLRGNSERLFSIFGRQRFEGDAHHWGYTAESLAELLGTVGYVDVRSVAPTDYHALSEPCIRVEAKSP